MLPNRAFSSLSPVRFAVLLGLSALGAGCGSSSKLSRIPSAPVADILGPVSGEVFRQGGLDIPLRGVVSDDHELPTELTVSWILPTGETFPAEVDSEGNVSFDLSTAGLEIGMQSAVLRAVDRDGEIGEDEERWELRGPVGPPTAQIVNPFDGLSVEPGTTVTFEGLGSDVTTPAADLAFSWGSSLDGPIDGALTAEGRSIVVASALSEGVHEITLTVVDTDGDAATDTITVTVAEELPVDTGEPDPPDDPQPAEEGDLVFTEMMVNPQAVEDEVGEWIEMYNTSDYRIDIAGYSFHDDDFDQWLMASLIVEPNDYVVLCADTDPRVNGGVPCDGWFYREWSGSGIALANGEDELVLTRPDGVEIDWLHYDGTWFVPGYATGVDPDFLELGANNDGANWCSQTTRPSGMLEAGTPGLENDHCD